MRTRKTDTAKSATAAKKTPPMAKKSAAKAPTSESPAEVKVDSSPTVGTATVTAVEPKRSSAGRPKQVGVTPNSGPEQSVEQVSQFSTVAKPIASTKIVKKVVRKVIRRTPASTRAASARASASGAVEKAKIEETAKEKTVEDLNNAETGNEEPATDVNPSLLEDINSGSLIKSSMEEEEESGERDKYMMESSEELSGAVEPVVTDVKPVEALEPCVTNKKDELKEEKEHHIKINDKGDSKGKTIEVEDTSDQVKWDNAFLEERDNEKIEALSDQEVHEEFGGDDLVDDDAAENKAAETLEEEHVQLNAAATERKVRKEREIFVGGLDRDAVEEQVRKVFEYAGDVVEVRIHVDPLTNKNKGYAFVQFATKEQADRALSEMKNPVIHGKRCGTAPCEDNDTLFLGNICNTWTKEAIKQKLKDYGIEGVEKITLVADPRHEGLSRGFAFVEFSSHVEAMLAYKRLQKPDVVFGHLERTAKVAFAEPLREPDPEIMAQVKSVFIDGLPPHWDEDRVKEKFSVFGEIARIMLARNMSTAKRKDFGFVDFKTHEAAVSCVEGVSEKGLNDGNTKVKVRTRLSNPLPKMQAVKGGMCGGFRIGHGSSGTFPRFSGRGFGRGGRPFNRYGLGSYPRGPAHGGRLGFSNEHDFDDTYAPFHGRPNFGQEGRWNLRGAYQSQLPARPYPDRMGHGPTYRGYEEYGPYRRYPYSSDKEYDRSFHGRHFDDPYGYDDDVVHGLKRPYYVMDQGPSLAEPSRRRPRLDQSNPAIPFHETRYREDLEADGGLYHHNYYGSNYGGSSYPAVYRGDHTYGHGYYY